MWRLVAVGVLLATAGCQASRPGSAAPSHLRFPPDAHMRWQIQLHGAFDAGVIANVYDLDPYTTDQATVTKLDDHGRRTICHLDVGVSDTALPDSARLAIPALLGAPALPSTPALRDARSLDRSAGGGARWLDIRQWSRIAPVLTDRFRLCRAKHFQAVDADEAYGYAVTTGFALTSADQLTFDRRVATLAHGLGLAIGVRTMPAMATAVQPFTDFAVVEHCSTSPGCADYAAFIRAGKAVFDVETAPVTTFCSDAHYYHYTAIRKPPAMTGPVENC